MWTFSSGTWRGAASRSRTTRAGTPTASVRAGMDCVTTAPAPTHAPRPMVTPSRMMAPAPIQQSSSMRDPDGGDALVADRPRALGEHVVDGEHLRAGTEQDVLADDDAALPAHQRPLADEGPPADADAGVRQGAMVVDLEEAPASQHRVVVDFEAAGTGLEEDVRCRRRRRRRA